MTVTFGCQLPPRGPLASPGALRTLAQQAEALGFDSVWVGDHIVLPRHVQSVYPYSPDGVSPFDPDEPYCEPLSALHFPAGCTQRVRLGTDVLVLPYRHPVLTAKILATLDVLSGGRMILGVGAGWMREEFEALGLGTYAERGAVTNEYIRLFKELWTKDEPLFQGRYYQVAGVGFHPKPVQQPHPPIWIGGHTGPALRRAATLGDGWIPIGQRPPAVLAPAELADKIARLRTLTRQAGRPEEAVALGFSTTIAFERAAGSSRQMMRGQPEQIVADLQQYQALGVQNFIFTFRLDSVAGVQETMERIAREVLPLLPQV